jgi:transcriptional regulator with XRE-family HTH domain
MTPLTIRLREARQARGLTQVELARRAGVRAATINRIENQRVTAIDLRVLERIADALEMDAALLLRHAPNAKPARRRGGDTE